MASQFWSVESYTGGSDFLHFVAVLYERKRGPRGHYRWRRVRRLCRPCSALEAAEIGRASGILRREGTKQNDPAWLLGDYVDDVTQAMARLGAYNIVILAKGNRRDWSIAIGGMSSQDRARDSGRWRVLAHLGRMKFRHSDRGWLRATEPLGLRAVYVEKLPCRVGEDALTKAQIEADARAEAQAVKRRARAKAKRITQAEEAGDADTLARLRTGKSKTTRERAGRRAARTRKCKAKAKAKRSRAAQKAWKTRRENEEKRARRSEAAKRAWATRRKHECQS